MRFLTRARNVIAEEGTEGRNPFEVLNLAWFVLVGALSAFSPPPPGSLTADLPRWMVTLWYTLLCIGGLVALVGVWLRNQTLSLLVERAGMMIFSPSALLYSVALFSLGGGRAMAYGSVVLAFAISGFIRIVRIGVYIEKVRERVRSLQETTTEG